MTVSHIDDPPIIPAHPAESLPPIEVHLLTIGQTAEVLNVRPSTIQILIDAGDLPTFRIGNVERIMSTDIREFLARVKMESNCSCKQRAKATA